MGRERRRNIEKNLSLVLITKSGPLFKHSPRGAHHVDVT